MHKQVKSQATLKSLLQQYSKKLWVKIKSADQPFSGDDAIIHYAALVGAAQDIEALVLNGANVNLRGDLGLTALHIATSQKNAALVKVLLNLGANQDIKDAWGLTPIALAKVLKHKEIQELLTLFPRLQIDLEGNVPKNGRSRRKRTAS